MLSALRVEDAATSVTVDVRTYASPRARVARLDVLDDQHDHHPSHRHPRGGVVLRLGRWDEAEEAEEEKALAKAAKDDIAPRRTQVSLASMAGGDGVRYLEYGSTDAPKQKPKRHKLFRGRK